MNGEDTFIDSVHTVKKRINEDLKIDVREKMIKNVMKNDLNMRFKKILPISVNANSPKNLVLRQQFAIRFIEQLKFGMRIINIDETWLGMTDFRRRKWQYKDHSNSHPILQMQPRITLIAGVDTEGNLYASLL